MTEIRTPQLDQIQSLLAEKGYEVSETAPNVLAIREVGSGIPVQAVLEGDILFLSLNCTVVPETALTAAVMRQMLDADNGISTSYFQIYPVEPGSVAITLNNFCKLQSLSHDDEDDILACLHFLLIDVMEARSVLSALSA